MQKKNFTQCNGYIKRCGHQTVECHVFIVKYESNEKDRLIGLRNWLNVSIQCRGQAIHLLCINLVCIALERWIPVSHHFREHEWWCERAQVRTTYHAYHCTLHISWLIRRWEEKPVQSVCYTFKSDWSVCNYIGLEKGDFIRWYWVCCDFCRFSWFEVCKRSMNSSLYGPHSAKTNVS